MDIQICRDQQQKLVMVLDSEKALQNANEKGTDFEGASKHATYVTHSDGLCKIHGTRPCRQIRARRIVSQSDSIKHNLYSHRPKVQVYSKLSIRYGRHREQVSSLNRAGSKRRGSRSRRNSCLQNNSGRRNAVIPRLDPVIERKNNHKEAAMSSLVTDASITENRINHHSGKPGKGTKKRSKGIDVDVFAQLPLMDLKHMAGNCSSDKMLRKSSGCVGKMLELSQNITAPIDVSPTRKSKDDCRVEGSPKLDRLRQQLPLFLSSGSPPTSKKNFGKRTGSPGASQSWSASPDALNSKHPWDTQEPFIWGNLNGQRVEISEVDVLSLSESECVALQKVAEQRLREIDLGVSITVPKDESKLHGKNSTSMLRRAGVHLGGTKNKSKKEQDQVFSIPLVRVVENDQLLRLQTAWNDESDNDSSGKSSPDSSPKTSRRLSSSIESNGDQGHGGSIPPTFDSTEIKGSSPVTTPSDSPSTRRRLPGSRKTLARRCAVGLDTDTEIDDVQSKLLESLTETSTKDKKRSLLPPTMPQVPYVVQKCCAHILKHGLDVTGIFRVGGSKKRVKQLRQEFDHGVDVKIDEDYHAHDVAALLKEFFRDLPEALLTRELYSAFISTAKLTGQKRLEALRCLMWLLPMPNRDTLQQLLSFLATVAEYSEDRLESGGKTVTGNKMNVANLSVIFGPNILHRHKNNQSSGDAQFQVQSLERAEESTYVIKIVDDMIRSQKDLFMIPREIHDEILRTLQESDPDAVDFLLRRKAANYAKSPSPKFSIEKLDSPIEVVKHFPARTPETQPLASDMNNNNKNGNNSRNDQPPKFAEEANYRKSEWSRNSYSPIESQKRAVSDETPTKKETSLYKNSLTFTEEDMKDILNGNRSVMLKSTNRNESYKQSVPDNTTHDLKGTSHKARKELQMLPFNDILPSKPSDQLKTAFPRRQGLSLADAKNTFNHKEEVPATSTVSKNNKKSSYRTKSPSPVTLRSASATSGFEDMSSTSSESLSSNRPLTPKHKRSNKIQNFLERDTGVCSDSEPSTRTRQITQPTVLKSPHVPLHSLRLHKNTQSDKSTEDNIVDMSDLVPRTFREGRRISKDDLYLTQDMRRRLQRQQSIII